MSASNSPFDPLDTAPMGYTRARFASAAFARISPVTLALSLTGLVFGMQATPVKPPATAAAAPVATVSLCSWPGSRRWTCMSTSPGTRTRPAGISTTVAPSAGISRPTRAIRSPSMSTSYAPSTPLRGSTTRPPLSSFFMVHPAREQIQNGHAHRHAVPHLIEDHRIRSVRHFRRDLDTAIHRAGMHDDHVGPREPQAALRHAEDAEVFPLRREVRAFHTLQLDAQEHDHVGVGDRLIDMRRCRDTEVARARGNQRRRA